MRSKNEVWEEWCGEVWCGVVWMIQKQGKGKGRVCIPNVSRSMGRHRGIESGGSIL